MLTEALALAVAETPPPFVAEAAIAGCAGGCGMPSGECACPTVPSTFPPGKGASVPWVKGDQSYRGSVNPMNGETETDFTPPGMPYQNYKDDALNMTMVVGEAVIAGGATTEVAIQPTQGRFSGFYVEIYAVDNANPQSRQRVRVGRFFVGDCPGDCRTITVFSDVFEANQACCNGRPLRSTFGRTNNGQELRVDIANPNGAGNVLVQVIVRGYCHRGTCAC